MYLCDFLFYFFFLSILWIFCFHDWLIQIINNFTFNYAKDKILFKKTVVKEWSKRFWINLINNVSVDFVSSGFDRFGFRKLNQKLIKLADMVAIVHWLRLLFLLSSYALWARLTVVYNDLVDDHSQLSLLALLALIFKTALLV